MVQTTDICSAFVKRALRRKGHTKMSDAAMYRPRVAARDNTMFIKIGLENRSLMLIEPLSAATSCIPLTAM